jgi:hypothetical protein
MFWLKESQKAVNLDIKIKYYRRCYVFFLSKLHDQIIDIKFSAQDAFLVRA